jgi:hypothetical protein
LSRRYVENLAVQHRDVDLAHRHRGHTNLAMLVAFSISGTFGTAFCDLA